MKKSPYKLLIFDWNGTLSTAHLPLAHYGEENPVPNLYPGVKATLQLLYDQGYILAVASAASTRKLQFETSFHEIDRYFSCLQGSEGLYRKTDPELLFEIMAKFEVGAEHTLMIGDTEADMDMASRAQVDRIAIGYGLGNRDKLKHYSPLYLINSISELPFCLNGRV